MTIENSEEVKTTPPAVDSHITDNQPHGGTENTVSLQEKLAADSQQDQFADLNLHFNLTTEPKPGDRFLPSMAIWQTDNLSGNQTLDQQENPGPVATENNQLLPTKLEDFGWTARYAANFDRADQGQHLDLGMILGLPQGAPKELFFEKAHEQEDDLLKQLMS